MVSLLVFAIVCILILALCLWLIRSAPFADPTIKWILQALVVLIAILVIANRAGVFAV